MLNKEGILSEVIFKAVRSSGSGGQHVNKVATKVELMFNIKESQWLDELQKTKILRALSNRINKNDILTMSCDESRSQLRNKTIISRRFLQLLEASLKKQKQRKPTHIPSSVKQKRLDTKRKHSEKKAHRKPPNLDK